VIDADTGAEVFTPGYLFEQHGVEQYSQIKLITANVNDISKLRKQIESLGFQTSSPIDTVDQINQIFKYFNVILAGFGSIGMIVAVLGMFNTLTVSLLERTSEIGLMIALGGRNRDMRRLFTIEASLLSLLGAVTGIIIALIVETAMNLSINAYARSRGVTENFSIFATPIWLIAAAIIFMILIGRLVVLLPAYRASRIDPIDALRRE
jgi:ABC-type antimicrobial peptide transport system permease subunit